MGHYLAELAAAGCSGLVVELVRRWQDRLPQALVDAAHQHGMPLITLGEETKFVSVTEAVIARIRDAQLAELRATQAVHEVFTALTMSGAEPAEVLAEAARLTDRPVVLETLAHQVLAYAAAGRDPVALLSGWVERSRAAVQRGRTCYHPEPGWLTTVVGARGDDWGRLVVLCGGPPPNRYIAVAERAASVLAVNRLMDRERESLERQAHRALLTGVLRLGGTGRPVRQVDRARHPGGPPAGGHGRAPADRAGLRTGPGDPAVAAGPGRLARAGRPQGRSGGAGQRGRRHDGAGPGGAAGRGVRHACAQTGR